MPLLRRGDLVTPKGGDLGLRTDTAYQVHIGGDNIIHIRLGGGLFAAYPVGRLKKIPRKRCKHLARPRCICLRETLRKMGLRLESELPY